MLHCQHASGCPAPQAPAWASAALSACQRHRQHSRHTAGGARRDGSASLPACPTLTLQPHSELRMQVRSSLRCTGQSACHLASADAQKGAQVRIEMAGLPAVTPAGAASGCSAQRDWWGSLLTHDVLQWLDCGQSAACSSPGSNSQAAADQVGKAYGHDKVAANSSICLLFEQLHAKSMACVCM